MVENSFKRYIGFFYILYHFHRLYNLYESKLNFWVQLSQKHNYHFLLLVINLIGNNCNKFFIFWVMFGFEKLEREIQEKIKENKK